MKAVDFRKSARQSLSGNWGKAILVAIITLFLSSIISILVEVQMVGGFKVWLETTGTTLEVEIVNSIVSILFIPLVFGYYGIFLSLREQKVDIKELFTIYATKKAIRAILLQILVGVYTTLWALLLIIPGIIKSLSYSQVFFIFHERQDLSLNEMITESRRLMDGNKWRYFCLNFSFFGWAILSLLTLGIGFLWLFPYIMAANAEFYHVIKNEKTAEVEAA